MAFRFWHGSRLAELVRAVREELAAAPGAPLPPALLELFEALRARQPRGTAPSADEAGPTVVELLAALPDAAGIVGAQGTVVLANPALDALAGGRAQGRSALEMTRSEELSAAVKAALDGRQARMELTLPATQRTVLAQLTPLAHRQALLLLRDLTEAKRLETARRDFVTNASHELRTPIAAIGAASETLLSGAIELPKDARNFLEMIDRHAGRLSRLTQDLLDLSRLESGAWELDVQPQDVRPIVLASVDAVRTRADEKSVTLEVRVPDGFRARCDRRALEYVLVNLLENGVKYTPRDGVVHVEGDMQDGSPVLAVVDTGPGIEPRHLARVFERFYRIDAGRSRETGGTGVGLAIAKHLVQAQGGDVGVRSGASGSRFWVQLAAE